MLLKKYKLPLFLSLALLMLSCEKEDNVEKTEYLIESTADFELISQNENGWIKQARYLRAGKPSEEFEYYENGYIKSARVYASYPQQHLYMEVSRSEDNKPLWSKYYNPDGELWFETAYANGLPTVKKVYSKEGVTIHSYTKGELSSVKFTAADHSSTSITTYDAATGSRTVSITSNGLPLLEEVYSYQEQVGAGVYANSHVPVANPFGATETSYFRLNQSFFQSPTWQNDADPIELMFPFRLYEDFYDPRNSFASRFAVSTELYQSVIEQYPITENGVLIGGSTYEDGYEHFQNKWDVRDSLAKVYDEDPALYKLKYGTQYVEKAGYGKLVFVIGAIRNLPTSTHAANGIKEIARRKMLGMLGGTSGITDEEQKILDKVWFEVKFFSTLKAHRNGVVITSAEDYDRALQEVNSTEPTLIQLKYKSVENL